MPIDPYIDPKTGILENKLGAKTAAGLALGEARAVFARLDEFNQSPIEGNLDAAHFKAIHRHLFQDVYSWAGQSRLTDMRRDDSSTPFTRAVNIDYQLRSRLLDLADADYFIGQDRTQFAASAAELLRDLNAIHPFAEGNGRTQRAFIAQLAEQVGHTIRWGIDLQTPDQARVKAFNDAARIAHNEGDLAPLVAYIAGSYEIPLPEIRRNSYPEPDRAEIQERIATDVEQDTFKYLDRYRALPESQGGRYVCSDLFKETFPEYAASPESRTRYNSPLHNSAAVLAAVQLESAIADSSHPERNTVIFLTGTPGAGKTSSIVQGDGLEPHIRAVYEGQLATPAAAIDKIQTVLDTGLTPEIVVVHIAPEFALQNTLSRFDREGRGSSAHAMATIHAQLPTGLCAIRDTFGDQVKLTVFDRTPGLNNTIKYDGWDALSILEKEGSYDEIRKRLTDAIEQHREAGTISEEAYRQAAGLSPQARPRSTDRENAQDPEQLREGRAFQHVEHHGALRFWEERDEQTGVTVKHAAGRLDLPPRGSQARDIGAQRALSQGTGYHAGHLIAHRFGGPEIAGNLSLQNHLINQGGGAYFKQEQRWADELRAGNAVAVHIREVSRDDASPAFQYRDIQTVITKPTGELTRETIAFLNPETEKARQATRRVVPQLDEPATIINLDPRRRTEPEQER